MALEDLWRGSAPPTTVFSAYNDTAQALNKLRGQRIANALNQIKLNYAPQMAQQGADLGAANVKIKQSDAQYEPSMNAADLAQKHAMTVGTNLLNQGRNLQNLMDNEKFKQFPEQLKTEIQLKQAQIQEQLAKVKQVSINASAEKRRQSALSQFNQTLKGIPSNDRGAYIAQHADQLQQLLTNNLDDASNQSPANMPPPAPQSQPFNPLGNMSGTLPSQQNQAIPPMIAAPQNQGAPSNAPTQQQEPSALENQSKFMANAKAAGTQATRRLNSAIELEKIMNDPDFDALAKNASKYAGIKGKIKGGIDAWFNSNPKEYNDYLQFKNQYASMITNVMRQVEGLGVQESTREEIRGNLMQSLNQLSSNPERALEQYNRTKNQLKKLGNAASVAAQPTFPGAREKAAGINFSDEPSSSSNESMVDIISPDGRHAEVPAKNLEKALARGYRRA